MSFQFGTYHYNDKMKLPVHLIFIIIGITSSGKNLYIEIVSSFGTEFSWIIVNPLRAKFFLENIKMYSQFVSFLHTDLTHVIEILPPVRQELTYSS